MAEDNDVELIRIRNGSYIVGGSIIALLVAVLIVCSVGGTVTDRVALLGSITTFLGAVIGVFFGVNSSGSARAQNATTASDINETAGKMADATMALNDTARSTVDLSHNLIRASFLSDGDTAAFKLPTPPDPGQTEMLAGDPEERPTPLVLPAMQTHALNAFAATLSSHVAVPKPAEHLFATNVLNVAKDEAAAHISRASDQGRVTEYLKLLGLGYLDDHGVPTRYCAAGLTWSACKAYCDLNQIAYEASNELLVFRGVLNDINTLYFKPSAGCQAIMDDAKRRGAWLSLTQVPKPGYIVLYNWAGGSHAEHIGWVENVAADGSLHTIEFNTTITTVGPNQGNGGAVAQKVRALKFVLGYVRTY